MLNDLIMYIGQCPVCGRYYHGPLENWWCPYCGPSMSLKAIQQIENLTNRVEALEALVNQTSEDSD